ncbi:MAG: RNB domain-containing ribonuclease [Desulfovibrionaceae bacterium]|nr:RNB domain-containing ribonuclease [Desulfovibrionaceae bacterium]
MSAGLIRHPAAGCIVEFMQGNTPQTAWVLDAQGDKLRVLLQNRRETPLSASRLLPWSGPQNAPAATKDSAIAELEKHMARRAELTQGLDPLEWWELAQGEMSQAPAEWFAGLAGDDADCDLVAACGHALLACKTHFKFQPPLFEVLDAEKVAKKQEEQEREKSRERLLKQGTALVKALWNSYEQGGTPPEEKDLAALDADVLENVRTLIMQRVTGQYAPDDTAWEKITRALPDVPFMGLRLAQAWGLVGPHYNAWADRSGYEMGDEWSKSHAEAIEALTALPEEGELNPAPFISIDSSTTRDIDDAFHIAPREGGGWKLTLALACPALHWPFESELDKAVRMRATSLYLPEGVSNMLPQSLGEGHYSLFAGETRPALLVSCEIAPTGELISCTPSAGLAKLAANLAYEDCEAALDGQETPAHPYLGQLRLALELAEARQDFRVTSGAIIINKPDQSITLLGDPESAGCRVVLGFEPEAPRAHLIVSEQMIAANAGLAAWADNQGAALIFRTQNVDVPPEAAGIWTDPLDIARIVKFLAPAALDTAPLPHVGVGEARYATVTSPLRRYPDLINEAQILHLREHGSPRWSKKELEQILLFLGMRLDAAQTVQRLRTRYWKLVALQQQGDIWRPGIITDENDSLLTINFPCEQLIVRGRRPLFPEGARPGVNVEARLGRISPLMGDVALAEVRLPASPEANSESAPC